MTFLSDKRTFLVGQGDIKCRPANCHNRPMGQNIVDGSNYVQCLPIDEHVRVRSMFEKIMFE